MRSAINAHCLASNRVYRFFDEICGKIGFNLLKNFPTMRVQDLAYGMHISLTKSFQVRPRKCKTL